IFFTEQQRASTPGLWNYMIDAQTGDVLHRWNAIHTVSEASGPGGNAKYSHPWTSNLDVELQSGSTYKMDTTRLKTVDMRHRTTGNGTTATGTLTSFPDAVINDAHGYAEKTLNMLRDWQNHDSIDDHGFKILSRVHYDNNYENAFWDGTQMTYG